MPGGHAGRLPKGHGVIHFVGLKTQNDPDVAAQDFKQCSCGADCPLHFFFPASKCRQSIEQWSSSSSLSCGVFEWAQMVHSWSHQPNGLACESSLARVKVGQPLPCGHMVPIIHPYVTDIHVYRNRPIDRGIFPQSSHVIGQFRYTWMSVTQ
jgi:hypothetical protein